MFIEKFQIARVSPDSAKILALCLISTLLIYYTPVLYKAFLFIYCFVSHLCNCFVLFVCDITIVAYLIGSDESLKF